MVPPGGQIKMSAAVAIIPTPQEGTLFLNQACNSIQVMCFGPLCVPLLPLPEVHAGTQLKAITRLYEYGLKLSDKITSMHSKDTVRGDWHHRLRPLEEELGHDEDSTVKENIAECRLQVFLFMDGIKKNSEASVLEKLMLLETLRNNFDEIMRKNRVKVRKLMGTAINRVLKNLTVQEQKQNLLSSAIPTISDSIMCIVKKSTSECFRQSVFSSLKVTNSRQLNHVTQNKLWQIAKQRFDIKKPAVKRLFTRESEGHQNQNQNEQIHQPGGPMLPLPPEDISNQSLPGSFALADTSNQSWLDSFALADTRNQNLPGSFALADTSNQSLHGSFTLAGTNNQSLPGSFALADNSNQSWLDSFALADTNNQSLPGPFTLADNSNQSLPGSFESSSQFDDTNFDLLGSFGVENVDEMLLDQAQLPVEIDGTQPDQTRIRMTWDKADGGQSCGGSRAHTLADATLHSQPPVKRAKVQLGGHPPTMQSSRTGSPQITDEDWYNERLWDM